MFAIYHVGVNSLVEHGSSCDEQSSVEDGRERHLRWAPCLRLVVEICRGNKRSGANFDVVARFVPFLFHLSGELEFGASKEKNNDVMFQQKIVLLFRVV